MFTKIMVEPERLTKAYEGGYLVRGGWGDGENVCMMSALVPGATSSMDCAEHGWPVWLAKLAVAFYDESTGAADELGAGYRFAYSLAECCQVERDYEKARHGFLSATLQRVVHLDETGVVQRVIDLHDRALSGDLPVDDEWEAAMNTAMAAGTPVGASASMCAEWYGARDTEWSAARDAARSLGYSAAASAARDVEKAGEKLSAVRDAARDAVRFAVRDAARDAARSAAKEASRAAARGDLLTAIRAS